MGGAIFGPRQIGDMMFREPEEFANGREVKSSEPGIALPVEPQPGYQLPPPQPYQPQQQGYGEYYQQMRQGIESLDKVLKQLEGLQTPGGQYTPGPGAPSFGPAGFSSEGK